MKQKENPAGFNKFVAVFKIFQVKIPPKGQKIIDKMVKIHCHPGQKRKKERNNFFAGNFIHYKPSKKSKGDMDKKMKIKIHVFF